MPKLLEKAGFARGNTPISTRFHAISVDELGLDVSYVKMDVEGSEAETLQGIDRNHPPLQAENAGFRLS